MNIHNHPAFFEPGAYSFHMISQHHGHENYYYSCPAVSTRYNDAYGLDVFVRTKLKKDNHRRWIWIVDTAMCGFKHLCHSSVTSVVLKIITEEIHSGRLKNIIVVNQTLKSKVALLGLWCRMPEYIRKKVIFDENRNFSKLLKIDEKLQVLNDRLHHQSR